MYKRKPLLEWFSREKDTYTAMKLPNNNLHLIHIIFQRSQFFPEKCCKINSLIEKSQTAEHSY